MKSYEKSIEAGKREERELASGFFSLFEFTLPSIDNFSARKWLIARIQCCT